MRSKTNSSRISGIKKKLWESPTITSWASIFFRTLSVVLILPLVLTRFSSEEIALWYLFATMAGLQLVVDMGFSSMFSRIIAYAMGGASDLGDFREQIEKNNTDGPNWNTLKRILGTMGWVYYRLALVWFAILFLIATWASSKLVADLSDPAAGWGAVILVVISSAVRLYGSQYSACLLGYNKIALLKRWESLIWLLILIASIIVLLCGAGLFGLVLVTYGSVTVGVLVNRCLCRSLYTDHIQINKKKLLDAKLFTDIWPGVWRSGVGIAMSAGLIQGSGIVYARLGATESVAAYLLALNLLRVISQFAQAPFYSKLPLLAKLRAKGAQEQQILVAKRGMRLSHWTLVIGIVGIGYLGENILKLIDSEIGFVSHHLWILMGTGLFLERYGAMYLQLYSTTNHIIWHIANGVTGLLYLIVVFLSFGIFQVYSFPLAQVLSNLAFYTWYSARMSYKVFSIPNLRFESGTTLGPAIILIVYFILTW